MQDCIVAVADDTTGTAVCRVRGLMGHSGLARWLEAWFRREAGMQVMASVRTGRIRMRGSRLPGQAQLEALLARSIAEFDGPPLRSSLTATQSPRVQTSMHATAQPVSRPGRPVARAGGPRPSTRPARGTTGQTLGHALSLDELFRRLDSSACGLPSPEAAARFRI